MSDVMLHGVLNMPPECWSNGPLDVAQRHSRYVEASYRIQDLERELAEVTKQRDDLLESLQEVMPYIVGDRCVPWKKAQDAIDRATEGGAQ